MADGAIDFSVIFSELASTGERERTMTQGDVSVRLVRLTGGGEGRWDRHDDGAETVIVWSGAFTVEFRTHTLHLTAGQCCVVPSGADHRGTSPTGAEVVLFRPDDQ